MPTEINVTGAIANADGTPVIGGKVIATFEGFDYFDGKLLAGRKVDATTGATGAFSIPLLVNGEGDNATSTWSIVILSNVGALIRDVRNLFVAVPLDISLADLEKTSAQNLKAARDAAAVRIVVTTGGLAEYDALPADAKRPGDLVVAPGV